jgi:hypothetical protein
MRAGKRALEEDVAGRPRRRSWTRPRPYTLREMKWLILGASLLAVALAIWLLVAERRPGRPRSTPRGLIAVVAALAVFGALAYLARFAGIFSLPILIVIFLPFGLSGRWLGLASRDARVRREATSRPPPATWRQRVLAVAYWPIFVILVLIAALVGLAAGIAGSYR